MLNLFEHSKWRVQSAFLVTSLWARMDDQVFHTVHTVPSYHSSHDLQVGTFAYLFDIENKIVGSLRLQHRTQRLLRHDDCAETYCALS